MLTRILDSIDKARIIFSPKRLEVTGLAVVLALIAVLAVLFIAPEALSAMIARFGGSS